MKNKNKVKMVEYWEGLTVKQKKKLCKDAKKNEDYIRQVFYCFVKCGAATASQIDKLTNGKVTKEMLRKDIFN